MGQGPAVLAAGAGVKLSDFFFIIWRGRGGYFNFNRVLPGN